MNGYGEEGAVQFGSQAMKGHCERRSPNTLECLDEEELSVSQIVESIHNESEEMSLSQMQNTTVGEQEPKNKMSALLESDINTSAWEEGGQEGETHRYSTLMSTPSLEETGETRRPHGCSIAFPQFMSTSPRSPTRYLSYAATNDIHGFDSCGISLLGLDHFIEC